MSEKVLEKATDFIRSYGGSRTALLYDVDPDGQGAAAIVDRTLKRRFGNHAYSMPGNHFIPYISDRTRHLYDFVERTRPDAVITVDMAVHQSAVYVKKIARSAKVLVLDHHQCRESLSKIDGNIVHVNSNFLKSGIEPHHYCTSKLAYDACKEVADLDDIKWAVGAGIIGDGAGLAWKPFIDSIYEAHPELSKGSEPYGFKSGLGEISLLINSGMSVSNSDGAGQVFEIVSNSTSPADILTSGKLREFRRVADAEVERLSAKWRDLAEIYESSKLAIYMMPTETFVGPEVAIRISAGTKEPYTFVLAKREGNLVYIGFRTNNQNVNCADLARFSGDGGGHKPSAGANILTSEWEGFKERVLQYMMEHRS